MLRPPARTELLIFMNHLKRGFQGVAPRSSGRRVGRRPGSDNRAPRSRNATLPLVTPLARCYHSRMHPNAALITRFYAAFSARDAGGMGACYSPDVTFTDPAFGELHGDRARGMWSMLCGRAADLRVEASAIQADEQEGRAHWEAWYTFSQTGRPVHNVIEARFQFKDGLISVHTDTFSFSAWSKQALGAPGYLLGWTSFLQNKVRGQALKGLDRFLSDPAR